MPKRVPPLSAVQLAQIKPDPSKVIELTDGAVPGLRFRLTPAGTRSWSLNIRENGVMRRYEVGQSLGLSEARSKAEKLKVDIKNGADPTAEKRARREKAKLALDGIGTLGSLIDRYFQNGPGETLKSKDDQRNGIRFVFSAHLKKPALELKPMELQLSADNHKSKVSAARAVAYLNRILRWAEKRELVVGDFDLEKPNQAPPKQRVLDETELAAILPLLEGSRGMCARFILLTGARISAATKATWPQINWEAKTWTIPSNHLKDTRALRPRSQRPKKPMFVPLSRQAIKLLRMVEASREQILMLRGPEPRAQETGLIFTSTSGTELGYWSRWFRKISEVTGITGWSAHALRRTSATLAGDPGRRLVS
jgi:integrase